LRLVTPTDGADDDALFLRAAEGDEPAFARLVGRHEDRLVRYLARFVGASDADDLAQDVFIDVWKARHRYRPEGRFVVFLLRCARNRAVQRLRWRAVRDAFARNSPRDDVTLPHEAMRDRALVQALQLLPQPLREAVVLRHACDLDYGEIAAITGVVEGTLRARVSRGLVLLRDHLEPQGAP
jgi:RNA polymerase sigma-70 factor (ECF subfamily)